MMMLRPRNLGHGFSLVEVVLAVGIVVFALLAMVGLFSVGHMASRRATDQTSLAAAALQVISKARAQTNLAAPVTYYFDLHGQAVSNIDDAAYVCLATFSTVPTAEMPDISTNLARLQVQFTWPASVPTNRPYTNTFYANLSTP